MDKDKSAFFGTYEGDAGPYRPLLTAETACRMKAGAVTLIPGDDCGVHSTEGYEEIIIVLAGEGEARVAGREPAPLAAGTYAYIPPHTTHCIYNVGVTPLKYIYVVAPASP